MQQSEEGSQRKEVRQENKKQVFVITTIFTKQKNLKNPPIFFPVVRPPCPSFENTVTFGRVLQAAVTCTQI